MIKTLKNNLTPEYLKLKQIILSPKFNWNYHFSSTVDIGMYPNNIDMPYYSHNILIRPESTDRYITPNSIHTELTVKVLDEIIKFNKILKRYFYLRINVNCVHPDTGIQYSIPHTDHCFPHLNILIYLTSSGGSTYIEDECYNPKEDDVILFSGKHYMQRPTNSRRIVLVATIFDMVK